MVLRILLAAAFLASPSVADDPPAAKAGAPAPRRMEWKVGDAKREALVFLPPTPRKAPVVFVWHGHGGGMNHLARTFSIQTRWPEAIVVYPQGLPTPGKLSDPEGKLPGWQHMTGDQGDRDLRFFDAMLATLRDDLDADMARVYATGHSNGGRFTYLLWAARPDVLAAVAPSSSTAVGLVGRLKPKPCLHIAGETDTIVQFANQQRTMDNVRKLNGGEPSGHPRAKEDGIAVTVHASPTKTPFLTAIHPGGHKLPEEAGSWVASFFKDPLNN